MPSLSFFFKGHIRLTRASVGHVLFKTMRLDYVIQGLPLKGRAVIGPEEETEPPSFLEPLSIHTREMFVWTARRPGQDESKQVLPELSCSATAQARTHGRSAATRLRAFSKSFTLPAINTRWGSRGFGASPSPQGAPNAFVFRLSLRPGRVEAGSTMG